MINIIVVYVILNTLLYAKSAQYRTRLLQIECANGRYDCSCGLF